MVTFGALVTGGSSTLMHLAGTSGATAAFFRCLYALPVLGLLAVREARRWGLLPLRQVVVAIAAGVFLAVDLILWFDAIFDVGAGLATVLQDTQVVFVAAGAWLVFRTRPPRRLVMLVPVLLAGVWLVSGVVGSTARENAPLRGTVLALASAVAYAGFLLLMSRRPDRHEHQRHASFLTVVTIATGASALLAGLVGGGLRLEPSWPSAGWLILLALNTQVLGWLVISVGLARVTSLQASVALLLQPVAAVFFASVFISETPTLTQLAGVAIVVVAIAAAVLPDVALRHRPTLQAVTGLVGATEHDD